MGSQLARNLRGCDIVKVVYLDANKMIARSSVMPSGSDSGGCRERFSESAFLVDIVEVKGPGKSI